MRTILLLSLVATTFALDAGRADACSLIGNDRFEVDPAQAADHTPPGAVAVTATVSRPSDSGGCLVDDGGSCGYLAAITINVDATDDATATERLGYQLRVIAGEAPSGFRPDDEPVVSSYSNNLYVYFNADAPEGFQFDLEVRAVDRNGNLGPPSVLTIQEPPGAGGCASGTSSPALGLGVLILVLRRRARR